MAQDPKFNPPNYPPQAHYDAGPYQGAGSPPPGNQIQPYQSELYDQSRGYDQGYNQYPPQGYPPQGGYYPPQQGYGPPPGGMYYQQGPPQGYYGGQQRGPGAGEGKHEPSNRSVPILINVRLLRGSSSEFGMLLLP